MHHYFSPLHAGAFPVFFQTLTQSHYRKMAALLHGQSKYSTVESVPQNQDIYISTKKERKHRCTSRVVFRKWSTTHWQWLQSLFLPLVLGTHSLYLFLGENKILMSSVSYSEEEFEVFITTVSITVFIHDTSCATWCNKKWNMVVT